MTKPKMWIMKITPDEPRRSNEFFDKLFVDGNCKTLIGYTKYVGKIDEFKSRWDKINIGDLVVVIEGYNKVIGVVRINSQSSDVSEDETDEDSDWFIHRRRASLIKKFNPNHMTDSSTNRDCIIEYSGEGAMGICDEVWDLIKDDYCNISKQKEMKTYITLLRSNKNMALEGFRWKFLQEKDDPPNFSRCKALNFISRFLEYPHLGRS